MFRIDPTTIYSRRELIEALKPMGINADAWIARIRPIKRFRRGWWGADIIKAIEAAPPLNEQLQSSLPGARNRGNRRGKNTEAGAMLTREFITPDGD